MKFIRIAWARWRLKCAEEEMSDFQSRFDVCPLYLVNTRVHINSLRAHITSLRA